MRHLLRSMTLAAVTAALVTIGRPLAQTGALTGC
jgi:hypothetical protein